MDTMTSTVTKAVSNTKLAIATFAMFAAGSIALAVLPASVGPAVPCTDTDGGINYSVKGTASGIQYISKKPITATDSCNAKGQLYEQFCNSSGYQFYVTKTCATGTVCSDGACVKPVTTSTAYCTDTDNGINLSVMGTTTLYSNGQTHSVADYCNTTGTVREYYCVSGNPASSTGPGYESQLYPCSNGCSNGVCLASSTPMGKLSLQLLSNDVGFNKDRILLAGTSAMVGKIQVLVGGESVKIKDLKLTNVDTSGADDDLASVCLYRASVITPANLIACQTVDSNGAVIFKDINEVSTIGIRYWYIYATANKINNMADGVADSGQVFSFNISSAFAEGAQSGSSINAVVSGPMYTKQFVISGTKIGNVSLVSSYGGYTVDNVLSGTGEYTVAILAVTTQANDNVDSNGAQLTTKLSSLRFDVSKFASNTLSSVTIQKIGGMDSAGQLTMTNLNNAFNSGIAYTNNLSSVLANDYVLESGTTSYFVVKATLDNFANYIGATNYIQFNMLDLVGSVYPIVDNDNNVDWSDGSSTFHGLLLDISKLTGTKIVGK